MNFSSNMNEVIRAVLKSFFLQNDFACTKSTESTKITKMHKDTQAKAQNTNKGISDFFPLRCFLRASFIFVRYKGFALLVLVKFLNREV